MILRSFTNKTFKSKNSNNKLNNIMDKDDEMMDYLIKVVILGDPGVGKTNIL